MDPLGGVARPAPTLDSDSGNSSFDACEKQSKTPRELNRTLFNDIHTVNQRALMQKLDAQPMHNQSQTFGLRKRFAGLCSVTPTPTPTPTSTNLDQDQGSRTKKSNKPKGMSKFGLVVHIFLVVLSLVFLLHTAAAQLPGPGTPTLRVAFDLQTYAGKYCRAFFFLTRLTHSLRLIFFSVSAVCFSNDTILLKARLRKKRKKSFSFSS
jgi:hypothetical protein